MAKSTVGGMEMYILPLPMEGSAESHAKGVDVSAKPGVGGGVGEGGGVGGWGGWGLGGWSSEELERGIQFHTLPGPVFWVALGDPGEPNI